MTVIYWQQTMSAACIRSPHLADNSAAEDPGLCAMRIGVPLLPAQKSAIPREASAVQAHQTVYSLDVRWNAESALRETAVSPKSQESHRPACHT